MTKPHPDIPVRAPAADLGRRHRPAVRGRRARSARPRGPARPRGRRDPGPPRLSARRSRLLGEADRADRDARLGAEIRWPLHPAKPDRRSGAHAGGGLHQPGRVRACARFDAGAGGRGRRRPASAAPGALLGQGHLAMTIDQGAGHEPLSGPGGARRRRPGGGGARIFPALGADSDARAARGRRGNVGRARQQRWRAGGVLLQFLPQGAGARARRRSRSGRCAGRRRAS